MTASVVLPGQLEIGAGAIQNVARVLSSLCCDKPCIITDKTMVSLGYADRLIQILGEHGFQAGVFDETEPEPGDLSVYKGVEHVNQHQYDCLIALGGGSAIDSAKAIALLVSHGGKMRDYKMPYVVSEKSLPLIAIPTTAGTGSETTKVVVISDAQSDEKMLCMGPGLIPQAAVIDYELTLSLPPRVAADTGIDALTHAIEAYVSRKANLFSDQQAIGAMKLMAPNLIEAVKTPDNIAAKEAMMLGATLAGIAFSNASVALVHGMSRPLGVHFHIPHGMGNAMLLPAITEYSVKGAPRRYAECAVYMGLTNEQATSEQAHNSLITYLKELNQVLEVPSLKQFGVNKQDYFEKIPLMAEQAEASGSPANNPKLASQQEMMALYKALWKE